MKTVLQTLFPNTQFTEKHLLGITYHYQNTYHSISMNWINDWGYKQLITDEPSDWDGPEAKEFAKLLQEDLYTMNMARNFVSLANSLYEADGFEIDPRDYENHITDPLNRYGEQLGLPKPFINLAIIWAFG